MAKCKSCGAEINDQAVVCPYCGVACGSVQQQQQNVSTVEDSGSAGWGVLGFCIPLVGLILFLVWKDTKPKSSKAAGIGALISVIIGVVFYILALIIGAFSAAML